MTASNSSSGAGLVQRLSPGLTGKQRRHLRTLAHSLKPLVYVGQRGVSDNLIENVQAQLLAHELIKVKIHEGDGLAEAAEAIVAGTGAQLAQKIGHTLVLYKAHPKKPTIRLPRDAAEGS
ncbi:ribosome assembly RNA-binding protein YhbY [Lujinxingia litoralis]|uniref:Ribosome assembly RNA-binding protein YhbY n=1 Tax=Lujinxingia litoralis TaxID=2211119 RepID=A0A328C7V1_9DELT|nr:ribosome assembly RNA-binding protein YhbY [Lujinxingia litoralis]RAL21718.1 ribosome assembly RNA-binding protein YhbY [Lujinxingia litoralis]